MLSGVLIPSTMRGTIILIRRIGIGEFDMATDREIYDSSEWAERREKYAEYRRWYDGTYLDKKEQQREREGGKPVKRFPLHINVNRLACDVHRDIARGMPLHDDPLFVKAIVDIGEDPKRARELETIINDDVWRPSSGGPVQQEAILDMNIYGGCVFHLYWEPWDRDLPLGLAVRLIEPAYIFPKFDHLNKWRMLECYVGWEIDPETAELARERVRQTQPPLPGLAVEQAEMELQEGEK